MDVTISLIPYEDKVILHNLIQLYRYDSSEFDGHTLTNHGLYSYKYLDHQWTDDYRRPFIIEVDGEIAGFALIILDVPREFIKLSQAEKSNVISDFFISLSGKTPSSRNMKGKSPMSREGMNRLSQGEYFVDKNKHSCMLEVGRKEGRHKNEYESILL